jgi:NADPH-dependent 2,4-dienoyl-CoA reductase/sulfur reductase-like enzyme
LRRRDFLVSGAAAGAVAVGTVAAQPAQAAEAITWDREADVVVIGGGAGGLGAALAAREKGASVIIVEKNFDIGGRAMMSFGGLYIGGEPARKTASSARTTARQGVRGLVAPEKPTGGFPIASWCAPMPTTISICSTG